MQRMIRKLPKTTSFGPEKMLSRIHHPPHHFSGAVRLFVPHLFRKCATKHRENGGTLGMVPLIINPVYTLYSGYLDVFIG